MLRENLKDSAEILQNILQQPIEISGTHDQLSLLQAIQSYSSSQADHSDLSKMLRGFTANREHMEILIQELQLIAQDLTAEKSA